MIVLDTNVISELMRPQPSPAVIDWVDEQPPNELHLTAITVAELLYGIARLAEGRRRAALAEQVEMMVHDDFGRRVLAFDLSAAPHFADITARRAGFGRPIGVADAQIAATCRSHGATLATRNVKGFVHTDVRVVDPWRAAGS